eukprot:3314229-Prymnesium_polylepis.1
MQADAATRPATNHRLWRHHRPSAMRSMDVSECASDRREERARVSLAPRASMQMMRARTCPSVPGWLRSFD